MQPVIILHHHEIILKGENRKFFERQLLKNVRIALGALGARCTVTGGYGRFIISLQDDTDIGAFVPPLRKVFGVANICTGLEVEPDLEVFCRVAEQMLRGESFKTIKVDTRRPDKNFPLKSMDVNAAVGAHLCKTFGVRASMTAPDETVYIEIADSRAYVYRSKVEGAKGLPAGISGRVVALLSAGFDSPVAAWQLMKRGANVIFVHFHSMPYTSRQSVEQVRTLVRVLTGYQFTSKLYLIPFADVQQEIVLKSPQALRVIAYRRMMMRIAEEIAHREKAEGLVTGEAVGQVASQTLRNIRAIDAAVTLPVLRPLAGSDKEETIALARKIGTSEISQEPYDDCCSFLAPRKPETWANLTEVAAAEAALDVPALVARAIQQASIEHYSSPAKLPEEIVHESAI